jgi:hypothetical protein
MGNSIGGIILIFWGYSFNSYSVTMFNAVKKISLWILFLVIFYIGILDLFSIDNILFSASFFSDTHRAASHMGRSLGPY